MIFNEEFRELFITAKLSTYVNRPCVVFHAKWDSARALAYHLERWHRDDFVKNRGTVFNSEASTRVVVLFHNEEDAMEFYLSIST